MSRVGLTATHWGPVLWPVALNSGIDSQTGLWSSVFREVLPGKDSPKTTTLVEARDWFPLASLWPASMPGHLSPWSPVWKVTLRTQSD